MTSSPRLTTCWTTANGSGASTSVSNSYGRKRRCRRCEIWQQNILADYPHVATLALPSAGNLNLNPEDSLELRIHSIGGWDVIGAGDGLMTTAAELFGMHVKAYPQHGREKRGQPATYAGVLSHEPLRLNCELKHVDLVMAHDPNVFLHSDPLAGMRECGVLILQSDRSGAELWNSLPQTAQWAIRERKIKVCAVDAIGIARAESSVRRLRVTGCRAWRSWARFSTRLPWLGAGGSRATSCSRACASACPRSSDERDAAAVEDDLHVAMRGFDEVRPLDLKGLGDEGRATRIPLIPAAMAGTDAGKGLGNQGEFWNQVCAMYKTGNDVLADPFTAISAIPAATSTMRDMSSVRQLVPQFVADKCTGCSKCWVQCPDSAIPGVVNTRRGSHRRGDQDRCHRRRIPCPGLARS